MPVRKAKALDRKTIKGLHLKLARLAKAIVREIGEELDDQESRRHRDSRMTCSISKLTWSTGRIETFEVARYQLHATLDECIDECQEKTRKLSERLVEEALPSRAWQIIDLIGDVYSYAHCHGEVNLHGNKAMVYERCGCVTCPGCGPTQPTALVRCQVQDHASVYGDQFRKRIFGLFESCSICYDILTDPEWVRSCGHVFCHQCLERSWAGPREDGSPVRGKCPTCRATCCSDWGRCGHMVGSQADHAGSIQCRDVGVECSIDS
ncbi:hypothetical protein F5Y16DRAFT_253880 [Xylariaceae sp. FL0255]|nr:hypothetical protein F5Y16DRAFT_253880 [Xylariaceae sp. FL0255]